MVKRPGVAEGFLVLALALAGCAAPPSRAPAGIGRIQHIVVICAENRSFDNLYGLFTGADGIAAATPEQYTQVDYDGTPLPHLPPVWKRNLPGVRATAGDLMPAFDFAQ